MSTKGGGRRGGGGDRAEGGGGRGGFGGGRGRDGGGGSGDQQHFGLPPFCRPQAMSKEMEKLTIGDEKAAEAKKEPIAVSGKPTDELAPPVPSSSTALALPRRPGYGTVGMKCVVKATHFLVQVASRDLYHYDVAITPEVTSRCVCRSIITQLVELYKESDLGKLSPAYDGRKSLYTAGKLPFTSKTFQIKLTDRNRESDFDVTIKLVGRLDLRHLEQFLQGRYLDTPQETIQALDIVLREYPSQNYVSIARSFFVQSFQDSRYIGNGVECWKGYYQSLRPTQMGLSLNIDISGASFYKPISVVDFTIEYLRLQDMPRHLDMSRPFNEEQRVDIKKALRGSRVEIIRQINCCRHYTITGITNEPLSQLTFEDNKGMKIGVKDYFQKKHRYRLIFPDWPGLQCGSDKRPIYLPMEVCRIVEGQRFSKKLNEQQVTKILSATCQRPQDREISILRRVNQNNYKNDKYATEFGIHVGEDLTSIEARVLPSPMLMYHETGKEKTCKPSAGAWNMINKKMVNGGNIKFWACISFSRNLYRSGVYRFCRSLFSVCNNIGMNVAANPVINIMLENFQNVEGALRKAYDQVNEALGGRSLQLLLIILPEISGSYGKIKRVCETELGIVSQCCLPKHAQRCKRQYMENVALKINVKVGGRNTVLADFINRSVKIPLVTDRPTIFFGADVSHPSPGEDLSFSIAAVVASMDWPQITYYKSLVSAQPRRLEMIKDLYTSYQDPQRGPVSGGMVRELLFSFYKNTHHKPHRIIFYRDGVSESQFSHVLLYEIDAIRLACKSLEEDYCPPITFVVVQKRHHTRLFPVINSEQTDNGNILPGTVVDTRICHPTQFDFYLCSHAAIQGTSRPTHYHVLYDENRFTADGLQTLTNKLCYTYARCTRSVSIVPPVYYAHLAAFRARYYVEGDSEGESSAGGMLARTDEVKPLPRIKDNVQEVMFYC